MLSLLALLLYLYILWPLLAMIRTHIYSICTTLCKMHLGTCFIERLLSGCLTTKLQQTFSVWLWIKKKILATHQNQHFKTLQRTYMRLLIWLKSIILTYLLTKTLLDNSWLLFMTSRCSNIMDIKTGFTEPEQCWKVSDKVGFNESEKLNMLFWYFLVWFEFCSWWYYVFPIYSY